MILLHCPICGNDTRETIIFTNNRQRLHKCTYCGRLIHPNDLVKSESVNREKAVQS